MLSQKAIQSGDRSSISPLSQFDPEDHKAGIGIAPAHIFNEPDLIRGMLIWMRMRTSGTVPEGVPEAVIAVFPTVDILSVCFIFSGSVGNTVAFFLRIFQKSPCLLISSHFADRAYFPASCHRQRHHIYPLFSVWHSGRVSNRPQVSAFYI